jgi:hypothetical protein
MIPAAKAFLAAVPGTAAHAASAQFAVAGWKAKAPLMISGAEAAFQAIGGAKHSRAISHKGDKAKHQPALKSASKSELKAHQKSRLEFHSSSKQEGNKSSSQIKQPWPAERGRRAG